MKIYTISGLGADERAFSLLKLNTELIHLDWLKPQKNESIENYALRLSKVIDTHEDFGILGLSFGGLVATEISKQLHPQFTILISSIETCQELPMAYRYLGKSGLVRLIPVIFFNPPRKLAHYLFGTRHKKLLNNILNDTDLHFAKWAIQQLLTWKNKTRLKHIIKIQGTKDRLLPPYIDHNTSIIPDGGHFMIVDKADEISQLLNHKLEQFKRL